jgi:pimeloyl-ACP methyl ester carboxylesterase
MAPARVPAQRIGLLVYGLGGPGLGQRAALAQILSSLPAAVLDRFDIAAVEPLGVGPDGDTAGLTCPAGDLETWLGVDLSASTPAARAAVHAAARNLVASCASTREAVVRETNTVAAADAIEVVRREFGGPLTYVGTSYDTLTGYTYAQRHPEHLRALVLDSGLDPAMTGAEMLHARAAAIEGAFNRFAAACRAQRCFNELAAADVVRRLRDSAPAVTTAAQAGWSRRRLDEALLSGLADERNGWADLRNGLRAALQGNPDLLQQVARSYQARNAEGKATSQPVQAAAYLCTDRTWPRTPVALDALADEVAASAPVLGRAVVYGAAICTTWPVSERALPLPVPTRRPPVLVFAVDRDPVTPPSWSRRLAATFRPPAPVVTMPGGWHTALPNRRNACAITAAERFLLEPTSVTRSTTCPAR